jgi:hypothetical protein
MKSFAYIRYLKIVTKVVAKGAANFAGPRAMNPPCCDLRVRLFSDTACRVATARWNRQILLSG